METMAKRHETGNKITTAQVEKKVQVATPFEGISNKRKQVFQQDPLETNKIVNIALTLSV